MTQADLFGLPDRPDPDPIVYPIQAAYVEHWGMADALREWIANALDTHTPLTLQWADGTAVIEDAGLGLTSAHFALGASDKRTDAHAIGHFGEGWKLGLVVAAAQGRACRIDTVGFTLTPRLAPHPHFGPTPVLWMDRTPNTRPVGTRIRIACTAEEWETARTHFLALAPLASVSPHVFSPGGSLYVMGVRVMPLASLFSYSLTDRSLTNRDRHLVDITQAQPQITRLIEEEAAAAVLPALLQALVDGDAPLESTLPFQLPTAPRLKRAWRAAIATLPALALGGRRPEDDGLAALSGYTVLPPIHSSLADVLEECDVPRTSLIAERIRRDPHPLSLEHDTAWVFPVVPEWVGDMTVVQALRELIANALDADPDAAIFYRDQQAHVCDDGPGIQPDDFLLGHHTEQTPAPYGFFGVGLKAALAALAMTRTPVTVDTVGRTYTAAFEVVPPLTRPVLVLRWTPNTRTRGTEITLVCSDQAFRDARRQFRRFTPLSAITPEILPYAGLIYCHGLLVSSGAATAFGYDLPASDRVRLNFARLAGIQTSAPHSPLRGSELAAAIGHCWSATTHPDAIRAYWTAAFGGGADAFLEFTDPHAIPALSADQRKIWRAALRAQIGPKRCLIGTGSGTDAAEYNGYTPLPPLPRPLESLCQRLGVPTVDDIRRRHLTTHTLAPDTTPEAVTVAFNQVVVACRQLGWVPDDVAVSFSVDDRPEAPWGLTDLANGKPPRIRLNARRLEAGPQPLLATLLHEGAHARSRASDLSSDFERALTTQLGQLAWDVIRAGGSPTASIDRTALRALAEGLDALYDAAPQPESEPR